MKLLLSLILIITIAFNIAQSVNIENGKGIKSSTCFSSGLTSLSGITTDYVLSSFKNNVDSANGIEQVTNYQQGFVTVDFNERVLFVNFVNNDFTNGQSSGQIYQFAQNATEYFVDESSNNCYTMKDATFPQLPSVQPGGITSLGTVACDVLDVASQNFTDISFLVDQTDCSIISGNTQNGVGYPAGFSITNFYSYIPESDSEFFQLPQSCLTNPQTIDTTSNTLTKKEKSIVALSKSHPLSILLK